MTFSNIKYKDIISLEVAILKIIDINNKDEEYHF